MDLGKKFRKTDSVETSDDIKKMLEENKRKEKELLEKMQKQESEEKKQRELEEQKAREQQLLEDEKKRKEHMEKELAKTKEKEEQFKEQEKSKKIKNMVDTSVRSQTKSDHPDGCMCGKCVKKRKKIRTPKSGEKPYEKIIKLFKKPSKSKESKPKDVSIDAKVHPGFYNDLTVLGVRLAIGISFIVHGLSKMDNDGQAFAGMLSSWGMPVELAFPIALAELLAGIFLSIGFLTRIASALIGIIMLGAIFVVKGTNTLIGQGGVELDIIILSVVALLGIFGPGRFSVANIGIKGLIFDRKLH